MAKRLKDVGGLILFYTVIIVGVLLLNLRFAHINEIQNKNNSSNMTIAIAN